MIREPLRDIYVPVYAGEYTPAECMGRDKYVIDGKEYEECAFCRGLLPLPGYFQGTRFRSSPEMRHVRGARMTLVRQMVHCRCPDLRGKGKRRWKRRTTGWKRWRQALESLADKYGLDKLRETVARMSAQKKD